jgi:hypothetical protein
MIDIEHAIFDKSPNFLFSAAPYDGMSTHPEIERSSLHHHGPCCARLRESFRTACIHRCSPRHAWRDILARHLHGDHEHYSNAYRRGGLSHDAALL